MTSYFKRVFIIFLILIAFNSAFSQAQDFPDAISYLNYVGSQFEEISKDMMSYTSAASHGKSARKVEKKRTELIQTVKAAEANMRKLKPFKGDHALRDSVISYFHINGIVLNKEYSKIVDMEDVAEQSYDLMEAYLLAKERAGDKLDEAFEKAQQQQNVFAEKNNIKLVETSNKLSQKMEVAGKVNQYYNQVYLIFFKSYKDEIYLTDALNKKDVNAIEQSKNSLSKSANEGMSLLVKINSYNNDASLRNACMKALEFFQSEAGKTPELIDFLLKKENFDKSKKAFDAKRESQRTKADIDQYNKGIDEYNTAINKSNNLNTELNKGRSSAINGWNKAGDDFLDKHVPKYR